MHYNNNNNMLAYKAPVCQKTSEAPIVLLSQTVLNRHIKMKHQRSPERRTPSTEAAGERDVAYPSGARASIMVKCTSVHVAPKKGGSVFGRQRESTAAEVRTRRCPNFYLCCPPQHRIPACAVFLSASLEVHDLQLLAPATSRAYVW